MDINEKLDMYIKALEAKYGKWYAIECNPTELKHLCNFIDLAHGVKPMPKEEKHKIDHDVYKANRLWTTPWWDWLEKWSTMMGKMSTIIASIKK